MLLKKASCGIHNAKAEQTNIFLPYRLQAMKALKNETKGYDEWSKSKNLFSFIVLLKQYIIAKISRLQLVAITISVLVVQMTEHYD